MKENKNTIEVALILQPNAQLSVVYGLMDLFKIAQFCKVKLEPELSTTVRVTHWDIAKNGKTFECVFDSQPDNPQAPPDFLVIPPTLNQIISSSDAVIWADWIKQQHEEGVIICSVCTGAFLLAETGLLNGRKATTHWFQANSFQDKFPAVRVDTNKLVIDEGDIVTAGGITAWVDLGLQLTERIFGKAVMLKTAQFMNVDPTGRDQQNYNRFSPKLAHGDENILIVQHWLRKHYIDKTSISDMAEKAGLGERNFIRRFQHVTRLTPTQYMQKLRINQAKDLLELTKKNIEQISWEVGYDDVASFRKVFHKHSGLTPGEYRTKFWVA